MWRRTVRAKAGDEYRSQRIRILPKRNTCRKLGEKRTKRRRENKDELGGHAGKAKEHIEAADQELKAAAEFARPPHASDFSYQ